MTRESWIQQWGPYIVAVVGILVGAAAPWLTRREAAEGRAFEARLERARFMRSAVAEAQMAAAAFGFKLLLQAVAEGQIESDRTSADVGAAMDASLRLRELAAMTGDQGTADLLREAVIRIHNLAVAATNVLNLRKYNAASAENIQASLDQQEAMLEGVSTSDEELRRITILDLWLRLQEACAKEFNALTTV